MTRLILDAVVFQFPPTGIAKVTAGLCAACIDSDPTLGITALHRRPLTPVLPSSIQTSAWGRLLPYRIWRTAAFRHATRTTPVVLFPWNGDVPRLPSTVTSVTIIHDVLPLIIPNHFRSRKDEQTYRQRVQRDIDRSHLLCTDSAYSRQQILANFRVHQEPRVLRFGPTLHRTTSEPPPASGSVQPFFLYLGGYDPRKGIEQLLTVFLGLHREKRLASRLVLTGTRRYYSESFRALVAKGRDSGVVEERGYVDDDTVLDLLHGARALVYPSKFEGFGLPPLEAMTAGCPVITTRHTSLPEVCGDAVLYIDPDNPQEFGRALQEIENNEGLRQDLRARGLRQARMFTWEEGAEIFLSALQDTVRQRGRG